MRCNQDMALCNYDCCFVVDVGGGMLKFSPVTFLCCISQKGNSLFEMIAKSTWNQKKSQEKCTFRKQKKSHAKPVETPKAQVYKKHKRNRQT
jgi:hypothetical protein